MPYYLICIVIFKLFYISSFLRISQKREMERSTTGDRKITLWKSEFYWWHGTARLCQHDSVAIRTRMICLIRHVSKETGAVKDRLSNFWRCSRLWKEMSWESVKSHYVRRVENALKVIMHSVIKWIWMPSVRATFERVVFTKRSLAYCLINGWRAEKSEKWTIRHIL